MAEQVADIKQMARAVWSAGDFDALSRLIADVGEGIVRRVAVDESDEVLDVACGTGNATIPAARTGARVVGLDLTPKLLEDARRNAAAAGVEVEWVEGDAEELPFADASFDVVTSTFGCMFAPRQAVTAAELARVLRPGGRLGLCNWTPEGGVGRFFKTVASHLPPPPDAPSPLLWGTEDHVRELFAPSGLELRFERDNAVFRFDSAQAAMELYETKFGPMVMARQALEPQGRWGALRDDMLALYEEEGLQPDGGVVYEGEYLVVLGRKG